MRWALPRAWQRLTWSRAASCGPREQHVRALISAFQERGSLVQLLERRWADWGAGALAVGGHAAEAGSPHAAAAAAGEQQPASAVEAVGLRECYYTDDPLVAGVACGAAAPSSRPSTTRFSCS